MAGYSKDIICPYCGWQGAQYDHESRGEYRGERQNCMICGWDTFKRAEGNNEKDAPKEYEDIPGNKIILLAKIMVPFVDYTIDDEVFLEEIVYDNLIPWLLKQENWYKLINVIFGNYDITIEGE